MGKTQSLYFSSKCIWCLWNYDSCPMMRAIFCLNIWQENPNNLSVKRQYWKLWVIWGQEETHSWPLEKPSTLMFPQEMYKHSPLTALQHKVELELHISLINTSRISEMQTILAECEGILSAWYDWSRVSSGHKLFPSTNSGRQGQIISLHVSPIGTTAFFSHKLLHTASRKISEKHFSMFRAR